MRHNRTCISCDLPITKQSKTGRCRLCALALSNRSPEFQRRRRDAIVRRLSDPVERQRAARQLYTNHMKAREDPEVDRRLRDNMARVRINMSDPEMRARFVEGTPARIKKRVETIFAWCPPDLRDEYRRLRKKGRLKAAEAKRIILDLDAYRNREMTPFERALERVRNGAGIVNVRPIRRPDPAFTLGGVSSIDGATG